MLNGADESSDVAPEHPEVVKEILERVERLMQGFPEDIRAAYEATKKRPGVPAAIGGLAVMPRK